MNKSPSSQGYSFSIGHVWKWDLDREECWSPKIWCFWTLVLEKTLESPLDCKEIQPVHPKGTSPGGSLEGLMLRLKLQYLATSCEDLTDWKRPWCREGLGAGGKGDDKGWDGWMASPTSWTWVWVNSGSWWWTGRPGMLRFMGSQRVGTELFWKCNEISLHVIAWINLAVIMLSQKRSIKRLYNYSVYVYIIT